MLSDFGFLDSAQKAIELKRDSIWKIDPKSDFCHASEPISSGDTIHAKSEHKDHFESLMKMPIDSWLIKPAQQPEVCRFLRVSLK